jgi:hypothetical protein
VASEEEPGCTVLFRARSLRARGTGPGGRAGRSASRVPLSTPVSVGAKRGGASLRAPRRCCPAGRVGCACSERVPRRGGVRPRTWGSQSVGAPPPRGLRARGPVDGGELGSQATVRRSGASRPPAMAAGRPGPMEPPSGRRTPLSCGV